MLLALNFLESVLTHWAPAHVKSSSKDVNHGQGRNACWRWLVIFFELWAKPEILSWGLVKDVKLGWINETYKSQEEHAKCLDHTTPHKGHATSQGIGKEEDEDETCDHLDNAVNTLSEQGSRCAREAKTLEDSWCVVIDGASLLGISNINSSAFFRTITYPRPLL